MNDWFSSEFSLVLFTWHDIKTVRTEGEYVGVNIELSFVNVF